jgi:hypothetical protein
MAFGHIQSETLFGALAPDRIEKALIPGTNIAVRGRNWFMGQVRRTVYDGKLGPITGRIGFQSGALTEVWDDELLDFRERELPRGTTAPFAIDVDRSRVAFQLRPGVIDAKSFTSALQGLMNKADPTDRWRVIREIAYVPFEAWAAEVDRVRAIRIRLERPNPHYGNRKRVRELVEGSNARMVELAMTADVDDPQGIDLGEGFIREAIEHTAQYGRFSASGEKEGQVTTWNSRTGGAVEERSVPTDPTTNEATPEGLLHELDWSWPTDPSAPA